MSGAAISEIDEIFACIRAIALDTLESVETEQAIFKAIQLNPENITPEDLVFLFEKSSVPGFEVVNNAFQINSAELFIPIIQEIARYYLLQVKDRERFFISILTHTALKPNASHADKTKALDELRDMLYIVYLQAKDIRRCFLYALNEIINNNKTDDQRIKDQLMFPSLFVNYQFMSSVMGLMTSITKIKPLINTQEFISDYELIGKLFELLTPYISPVQQQLEKLYDSKIELKFKQAAGLSPTSHDKLVITNANCIGALLLQLISTINLELTPSLQIQNPALCTKLLSILNDAQILGNDTNAEIMRLFKNQIKGNFKEHRVLKLRLNDLYMRFNQAKQQEQIKATASSSSLSQPKIKPISTTTKLKANHKQAASGPTTIAEETELRRRKEEEDERRIAANRKEAERIAELQREETKRLAELKIAEQRLKEIRDREKELEIAKQNEIARAAKASSKEERAVERPAEFIELIKPQTEPSITVVERLNKMVGAGRHRILDKISKLYEDTKLDRKYTFEELATISEALDGIVVGRPPHVCIQFDITTAEDSQPKKAIVRLNTHTRTDSGGTLLGCYVNHFRDVLQRQSTDQKPGLGITKVILDAFIANNNNKLSKSFKA